MVTVVEPFQALRGPHAPPLLLLGGNYVAAIAGAVAVIGAGVLGGLIAGGRDGLRFLLPLAMGLAIWAFFRGTMDDWLRRQNDTPGPASGVAYSVLIYEWAWVAALFATVAWIGAHLHRMYTPNGKQTRLGGVFAIDAPRETRTAGLLYLLTLTIVLTVLVPLLAGPRVAPTLRGQVYFAIAAAAYLGALAAQHVSAARDTIWHWPAPLFASLLGLIWATLRPSLGGEYANINILPPNGLARALPVEMVSVGVAMLMLTMPSGTSDRSRGPS